MILEKQKLFSRKITDGTTFIVFDMEWNQPFPGRDYHFDVSKLVGEIIEIGAVKLTYKSGKLINDGVFSCDIKPQRYTKLHYHVKKVTHKTDADLLNGISFNKCYKQFSDFCGPDAIIVGWGNSDPDMLKMNLKFFDMDSQLGRMFLDVQPVFSFFAGERGKQRSVEFAVDYYAIPKTNMFHSATADAEYTAEIFKRIMECNPTSDVLNQIESSLVNPDIKREYSMVGAESEKKTSALKLVSGFIKKCPICDKEFVPEIDEFRIRKSVYALNRCPEHGNFFCRTRVKKNKSNKYYASAILRLATSNDYFLVTSKREEFSKYGEEGAPIIKIEQEKAEE